MTRYLLCRPEGGLNDIFSQIELCARYSEQTNRTLIVDTDYKNSNHFREKFSNYFNSRQNKLFLDLESVDVDLNTLDVFPHFLSNRVNNYDIKYSDEQKVYVDTETDQKLSFSFSQNYSETLLVHHGCGSYSYSSLALLRLKANTVLINELISRLNVIGTQYESVHVRNTDYQSNYKEFIKNFNISNINKLFVATDSQEVIDEFKQNFDENKIITFSNLPEDNKPLHYNPEHVDFTERNKDCLLDLLLLSLSLRIHLVELSGAQIKYSGFSILASILNENKIILKYLLGDDRILFGLQ